jgi:hypothetical protein
MAATGSSQLAKYRHYTRNRKGYKCNALISFTYAFTLGRTICSRNKPDETDAFCARRP